MLSRKCHQFLIKKKPLLQHTNQICKSANLQVSSSVLLLFSSTMDARSIRLFIAILARKQHLKALYGCEGLHYMHATTLRQAAMRR